MTNPLFVIYRESISQPTLEHDTLRVEERSQWFAWIAKARAAFRAAHPECVEPNGGVKPEHHSAFVDFCAAKYPRVRG